MASTKIFFLLLITLPSAVSAADENPWKTWERDLHRQCPANDVDWIGDGGYDELLSDFVQTLPLSTQRKISSIADVSHRCSKVTVGFQCEMSVHLDAFNKLGLLKRLTTFGCAHHQPVRA